MLQSGKNSNFSVAEMSPWTFVPVRGFPQSYGPKFLLPILLPLLPQTLTPPQTLSEVIGNWELFPIWESNSHSLSEVYKVIQHPKGRFKCLHDSTFEVIERTLLKVDLRAGPRQSEAPHPHRMLVLLTIPRMGAV